MDIKSFFIDVGKGHRPHCATYDPSAHLAATRKFLFWKEAGLFLASNADFHATAVKHAARCGVDVPADAPDAAGDVGWGQGKAWVAGWRSKGYQVETPPDLRPDMKRLLGNPTLEEHLPDED